MSDVREIKDTINVRVTNNTAFIQNVNLLGGTSDPLGVPSNLLYQWDLSTETYFGSVTAEIIISTTSNPTPVTYTVQVNGYNIQAVAFALNSLNLGLFQVSGNIIYVSNDFYIYGALTVNSTAFISTWDTSITNGSSSASNQIQLPLYNLGDYNFTVDWGDGTQDTITSWNQPETLHTYSVAGVYTISMVGLISEWSFYESTNGYGIVDDKKITSILNWGSLQFGVFVSGSFTECSNLDLSNVIDVPNLSNTLTFDNCFSFCASLTLINRSNEWDTSNINFLIATFSNSPNFNSNLANWNLINCIDANTMFSGATSFNQNIGAWNVSNVNNMNSMFFGATSFNQNIGGWNVGNVNSMVLMFSGATSFNQNIGGWNISNVGNFTGFMQGNSSANYSTANLDAIYNNWSTLTVQPNLTNVNFGTIKYTIAGQLGKDILDFAPNNWQIFDGGI